MNKRNKKMKLVLQSKLFQEIFKQMKQRKETNEQNRLLKNETNKTNKKKNQRTKSAEQTKASKYRRFNSSSFSSFDSLLELFLLLDEDVSTDFSFLKIALSRSLYKTPIFLNSICVSNIAKRT